jgi:hypothetical protein
MRQIPPRERGINSLRERRERRRRSDDENPTRGRIALDTPTAEKIDPNL